VITNWLLGLPPLLVYVGLFVVVGAESSGVPVPGETSLIAAAILASQHGGLSIEIVIAVAALAAIVGDNIGFVLGRKAGRQLLTREGRFMEHRRKFLVRGEAFFEKHGSRAVFLARWLPGLRVVGSWLAGAHHMRWRTFLLWNALGGIAWATSIGLAAYLFGHVVETIFRDFGLIGLAIVIVAAGAAFGWHRVRSRRREARDRAESATDAG
jgi:membrane protein DedA with SNARE-associated domain